MTRSDGMQANRRGLLGTAIAAGAVLAAGKGQRTLAAKKPARKKAKWQMKLSTSTIQFTKLPVEQALDRIAKLGFEAVDIWSAHAGCPHLDDVQKRLGAKGLRALLDKTGLKLFAFSVYRGGYPRYAELLGGAGGGVAVRGSGRAAKPSELTAAMKKLFESLKGHVELAEKYNSIVALENHGGSLLGSLDSFKAFVDNNPNPKRLGIALAPYHLQHIKASVPEAIRIAGKQLQFFYAWQSAKGVGQLPGLGPVDCKPWIAALAEIRYAGYVNPFMHHQPEPDVMATALAKSKKYLETCYAEVVGT